nr:glucose-1-phosphate cytidylyltransferase [Amylibacter sp.]
MQVLLLAGGLGSRLAEETVKIPKPMVEVGGRPIIMQVMDIYRNFGHRDFIVAAGYKSLLLKQYFNNFHLISNDLTVDLGTGEKKLTPSKSQDCHVSVVDTGAHTMTGGRILRLREWLNNETFMVTYSDGVGNIDIAALLAFHKSHGKLATVTAVQPPARFGNLDLEGTQVVEFTEKVTKHETWINGGFFVFEPGIFDYIPGDSEPMELSPLTNIARDGELMAYKHKGFWHPMDTVRDRDYLDSLVSDGDPPWMDFKCQTTPVRSSLNPKRN